jgi:hypothetical protein
MNQLLHQNFDWRVLACRVPTDIGQLVLLAPVLLLFSQIQI